MSKKINDKVTEQNNAYTKYEDTKDPTYLKAMSKCISERQRLLRERLRELKLETSSDKMGK